MVDIAMDSDDWISGGPGPYFYGGLGAKTTKGMISFVAPYLAETIRSAHTRKL